MLPHERTFSGPVEARLQPAARRRGEALAHLPPPRRATAARRRPASPISSASLGRSTSRLWRIEDRWRSPSRGRGDPRAARHRRRPPPLRGGAALPRGARQARRPPTSSRSLVSCDDAGLTIFPTHRLVERRVPGAERRLRLTARRGRRRARRSPGSATAARDHPAFVLARARRGAVLAELPTPPAEPLERLDVSAVDRLALDDVTFTPVRAEAEEAVASGRAAARSSFARRRVDEVQAIARPGRRCREKSTYFFPKLASGLLFSPVRRVTPLARPLSRRGRATSARASPSCRPATSASGRSARARAATRPWRSTLAAEDAIVRRLEGCTPAACDFMLVSEELGERRFGADPCVRVVVDPIDGSVNAKRGIPFFSLSVAVAEGPTMGDVVFGYVHDFGSGEEWIAERGARRLARRVAARGPRGRRTTIELLSFEATMTQSTSPTRRGVPRAGAAHCGSWARSRSRSAISRRAASTRSSR